MIPLLFVNVVWGSRRRVDSGFTVLDRYNGIIDSDIAVVYIFLRILVVIISTVSGEGVIAALDKPSLIITIFCESKMSTLCISIKSSPSITSVCSVLKTYNLQGKIYLLIVIGIVKIAIGLRDREILNTSRS